MTILARNHDSLHSSSFYTRRGPIHEYGSKPAGMQPKTSRLTCHFV